MSKKWDNMSAQEKAQENPNYAIMSRNEKESYNNFIRQIESGNLVKEFKDLSNSEKLRFNPKLKYMNNHEKIKYNKEAKEIFYEQNKKRRPFAFKNELKYLFSVKNRMIFVLFILPAILLAISLFWIGANSEPSDYRKCLDHSSAEVCRLLYPD